MKSLDIEIKIMEYFNFKQKIIVPNVHWGIHTKELGYLHECDILILSKHGYATEVEIKISKSDLKVDKKKKHGHDNKLIKKLYFAVPEELKDIALEEIPERSGLLIIRKRKSGKLFVEEVKKPKIRKDAIKWSQELSHKLAKLGTMRIYNLKNKIKKLKQT